MLISYLAQTHEMLTSMGARVSRESENSVARGVLLVSLKNVELIAK